jgi:hypothetical protein
MHECNLESSETLSAIQKHLDDNVARMRSINDVSNAKRCVKRLEDHMERYKSGNTNFILFYFF